MAHLKDLVVDGDARIIGNLYSSNGGGGGTDLNVIFDKVYPVGSIYMSVSPTNPGELFCGTWVAWGSGQVPVGVKTTDTDFATVEKTGGAKTASTSYTPAGKNTGTAVTMNAVELTHSGGAVQSHTLTINEMPSHTHTMAAKNGATGSYSGWTPDSGAVNVTNKTGYDNSSTGGGQGHTHGFTQPSKHSFTPTTKTITQPIFTGTQASITESTVQPYITCYMWKRTA